MQATGPQARTRNSSRISGNHISALRAITAVLLAHSSGGKINWQFRIDERRRGLNSARSDPTMEHEVYSTKRIVLVTGANKGIGKEIARKLASLPDHVVVLGCRDVRLGANAAAELRASGYEVVTTHLDLTNRSSIESTHDFIQQKFGKLDVLVNNAAICFNDPTLYGRVPYTPFEQQARLTIQTNYFGALNVIQKMLPLLRVSDLSPRIVNVASWAGRLRGSPEVQATLTAPSLDISKLSELMDKFVKDAEKGIHVEQGWPDTCYGVSKLGLIALTQVLAREEPAIMITSADPGYCSTDQNNNQGIVSAEQGAITPSMLAHLDFAGGPNPSGRHFYGGREMSWSYQ